MTPSEKCRICAWNSLVGGCPRHETCVGPEMSEFKPREMTLAEIVESLPEGHEARSQYFALKATATGDYNGPGLATLRWSVAGRERTLKFCGPVPSKGDIIALHPPGIGGWFEVKSVVWFHALYREGSALQCEVTLTTSPQSPLDLLAALSCGFPEGFPEVPR